jgi:GDP-D-mannose 3', 5'-epimerase
MSEGINLPLKPVKNPTVTFPFVTETVSRLTHCNARDVTESVFQVRRNHSYQKTGQSMSVKGAKALVCGGGGFIGGHLAKRLLEAGAASVRVVDVKPKSDWYQVHSETENLVLDLQDKDACFQATEGVDAVFQLAADMGGMGFIENNKALCMLSVLTNTHMLMAARANKVERFFYSSSACVYNGDKQTNPDVVALKEEDAYPALPEDGYGWEKLFSERMCRHFREDFGLQTRVARFHNVSGPEGTWQGGREKAPAAVCRKVLEAKHSGKHEIEIWGDGHQTRSFMYIDDCTKGIIDIFSSDILEPINLGSSELVTINQLVDIAEDLAGIKLKRNYNLSAPKGVNGRNSDNTLILKYLGWEPSIKLRDGLAKTMAWIEQQMLAGVTVK